MPNGPSIALKNLRIKSANRLANILEQLITSAESSELLSLGPEVVRKMLLGIAPGSGKSYLEELVQTQIEIALGLCPDARAARQQTAAFVALFNRAYGLPAKSGLDSDAVLKRVGVFVSQLSVLDVKPKDTSLADTRLETSALNTSESSGTLSPECDDAPTTDEGPGSMEPPLSHTQAESPF